MTRGMVALNHFSYISWCIGNVLGAVVGVYGSENLQLIGIDFSLTAMFAALLMLQVVAAVRKLPMFIVGCFAAAEMLLLELVQPHPFNLIVATSVAATCGAWWLGLPKLRVQETAQQAQEQV